MVRGITHEVAGRELTGHERDRSVRTAANKHPGFLVDQQRASDRPIPVFQLEPIPSSRVPAG